MRSGPGTKPAGVATVQVETLDGCLDARPTWRADFLKVDVEGADLDVLEGGKKALEDTFGVQIEVAFAERNRGAPLQPENGSLAARGGVPAASPAARTLGAVKWRPWRAIGAPARLGRRRLSARPRLGARPAPRGQTNPRRLRRALRGSSPSSSFTPRMTTQPNSWPRARSGGVIGPEAASDAEESVASSMTGLALFAARGAVSLGLALLLAAPLLLLGTRGRGLGGALVAAQAAPLFDALARAARRGGIDGACIPDR